MSSVKIDVNAIGPGQGTVKIDGVDIMCRDVQFDFGHDRYATATLTMELPEVAVSGEVLVSFDEETRAALEVLFNHLAGTDRIFYDHRAGGWRIRP